MIKIYLPHAIGHGFSPALLKKILLSYSIYFTCKKKEEQACMVTNFVTTTNNRATFLHGSTAPIKMKLYNSSGSATIEKLLTIQLCFL